MRDCDFHTDPKDIRDIEKKNNKTSIQVDY